MLTVTLHTSAGAECQVPWADVAAITLGEDQLVTVTVAAENLDPAMILVTNQFGDLVEMWETYLQAIFTAQFPEADG